MLNPLLLRRACLPAAFLLLGLPMLGRSDEKSSTSAKAIARPVHYSGQVQTNEFRAITSEIASGYPVTGWVKNLDDGRVELLVEGCDKDVEKFLDAVRTHWKGYIDKEEIEKRKPTGEFKDFAVRR